MTRISYVVNRVLGPGLIPALVLIALACAACSRQPSAQGRGREDTVRSITTAPVVQESVHRPVNIVGTLEAVDQVTISSQTDGAVGKLYADLGDRVRAGQVLVELDREKLEYGVDQQKAALARALARYGGTEPGHLPPIEQTPDVQKAAAELAQAKLAYNRVAELHRRELLPRQQLDDADATLRTKQAAYESSLQNARNLRADIDASAATVRLAERELRDTVIRAPFDGYVQKRLVSLGEFVKNQTPVMSIVRLDPLKVTGEIPEALAPWVEVGQPVELRVEAFPDRTITGKMSRISPTVNTQTRAFPFEALVPNEQALLKPGIFARVRLTTNHIEQIMTLPYAALQYRYGVNQAFVVTGDHVVAREVKLGDRLGDRIEITDGVKSGDVVAMTDVDNLVDGMKVAVARPGEKGPADQSASG
jgi:multidrug efflux pump subunit AcrA (membrane-fusion protein)